MSTHPEPTRDLTLLLRLDGEELEELVAISESRSFEPGEVIANPKEEISQGLYVIQSGEITLRSPGGRRSAETEVIVDKLQSGDVFGDNWLIFGVPFPFIATATAPTTVLFISRERYLKAAPSSAPLSSVVRKKIHPESSLKYLHRSALLSRFSDSQLMQLRGQFETGRFAAGAVLARQGEVCNHLFLIATGRVRLETTVNRKVKVVTRMTEGGIVGEQICVNDEPIPYTIIAETDVNIYQLPRASFEAFTESQATKIMFEGNDLPLTVVLGRIASFAAISPNALSGLASRARIQEFEEGQSIVRQGDHDAGEVFIFATGNAEVWRATEGDGHQGTVIDRIFPGQTFGEVAALTGDARNATVRVTKRSSVWSIDRETFDEFVRKGGESALQYFAGTFSARWRPRRADNVEIVEREENGHVSYTIKHLERNTYATLDVQGHFLWERLDGSNRISDLMTAFGAEYGFVSPLVLTNTLQRLQTLGFVEVDSSRLTSLMQLTTAQKLMLKAQRLNKWQVTWNADRAFRIFYRFFGRIFFNKHIVRLFALVNLAGGLAMLAILMGHLPKTAPLDNPRISLWSIAAIMLFIILIPHEVGHAVAIVHGGRSVLKVGFGLTMLLPYAFVDLSDSLMLKKRDRIGSLVAGLGVTSTTAAIAALSVAFGGHQLGHFFFETVFLATICYILFLFNLNPAMETDGYQMASILMGVPKLRVHALKAIRSLANGQRVRNPFSARKSVLLTLIGMLTIAFIPAESYIIFRVMRRLFIDYFYVSQQTGVIIGTVAGTLTFLMMLLQLVVDLNRAKSA